MPEPLYAWHELCHEQFPGLTTSENGGHDRDHRLELCSRAVSPRLLDTLEPGAQNDHDHHHGSGPGIASGEGHAGQDDQQEHERVHDRVHEQHDDARLPILFQHVRAVCPTPRVGVLIGESFRTSVEPPIDAGRVGRGGLDHDRRNLGTLSLVWKARDEVFGDHGSQPRARPTPAEFTATVSPAHVADAKASMHNAVCRCIGGVTVPCRHATMRWTPATNHSRHGTPLESPPCMKSTLS